MNHLYFWVMIGVLGFLLYISPGFLINRMYESFAATTAPSATVAAPPANAQVEKSVDATSAKTVDLAPSKAPEAASPTHNAIQNLMEVLNTPPPSASSTEVKPIPQSNSGVAIPQEYEKIRSGPESARALPGPSESLKHGDLYNTTLPKNPQPGLQGMLGAMGTQPRIPADRVVYVERREEQYDRPKNNPNCPDMRDYIRKDSIPCWGCKLS